MAEKKNWMERSPLILENSDSAKRAYGKNYRPLPRTAPLGLLDLRSRTPDEMTEEEATRLRRHNLEEQRAVSAATRDPWEEM